MEQISRVSTIFAAAQELLLGLNLPSCEKVWDAECNQCLNLPNDICKTLMTDPCFVEALPSTAASAGWQIFTEFRIALKRVQKEDKKT